MEVGETGKELMEVLYMEPRQPGSLPFDRGRCCCARNWQEAEAAEER